MRHLIPFIALVFCVIISCNPNPSTKEKSELTVSDSPSENEEKVTRTNLLNEKPIKILGAYHNPGKRIIVFQVHYLWFSEKGPNYKVQRAYIKLAGKEHPLNAQDAFYSASHTGAKNVIQEYIIRDYTLLYSNTIYPELGKLEKLRFGVEYKSNGKIERLERDVQIKLISENLPKKD